VTLEEDPLPGDIVALRNGTILYDSFEQHKNNPLPRSLKNRELAFFISKRSSIIFLVLTQNDGIKFVWWHSVYALNDKTCKET
jgi:hypothetical protein